MNVLSEKQDSQERDLAALKDELRELREQQKRDKDLILQLQTMASDNGWGIANLKGAQDQLKKDFITFKKLQERQNNTVAQVNTSQINSTSFIPVLCSHLDGHLYQMCKTIQD